MNSENDAQIAAAVAVKKCSKCHEVKTIDSFFSRKGASDGKMSSCKKCKTAATYAWRDANRDHLNAYQREYNSKPKAAQRRLAWRLDPKNKERQRELEKKRSSTDEYRARKKLSEALPSVKAYRSEYRKRSEVKARAKAYRSREHVKAERAKRVAERRKNDPFDRISTRMSNAIGQAIRKNHRSWTSLVGYTAAELMAHLEKQFTKGMSWSNYGEWHIDHIVPKSSFKYESHEDAEFKACWSLGNLRPLWGVDNLKKSDKQIFLM